MIIFGKETSIISVKMSVEEFNHVTLESPFLAIRSPRLRVTDGSGHKNVDYPRYDRSQRNDYEIDCKMNLLGFN